MSEIKVNPEIFPVIASLTIGHPKSSNFFRIDLPREAHNVYIQGITRHTEIQLLKKFVNKEPFTDEDYRNVFKFFITGAPRLPLLNGDMSNFLEQFGVRMAKCGDSVEVKLIEECIPQLKIETWDYIAVSLLEPKYTEIINKFDFGDINIYLGAWKREGDVQLQSLMTAFRSAFIFTILSYLYGDDSKLYISFDDFFEKEFLRRVEVIYESWKNRGIGEPIKYKPVYESFYSLNRVLADDLIKLIQALLEDDNLVQDDRNVISNRLYEAEDDGQDELISRATGNFLLEIQNAKEALDAAQQLCNNDNYENAINYAYFSMVYAAKALIEKKKKLFDFRKNKVSKGENFNNITEKLKEYTEDNLIAGTYYIDYKYVKQKKRIVDLKMTTFTLEESQKCIRMAEEFYDEIKRITYN